MASTLEIINGISQVMANTHDGALDSDGTPIEIGLKREEGNPIIDERVMDGFFVKFIGDLFCIYYHGDITLKELHNKDFESDMEDMIRKVAKFLKKEYKKITGSALSLKKEGEVDVIVQSTSRVRAWVIVRQDYRIGGADMENIYAESESKLDDSFRKWLELGHGKKAQNDTRKKDNFDHFDPTNIKSGIRK